MQNLELLNLKCVLLTTHSSVLKHWKSEIKFSLVNQCGNICATGLTFLSMVCIAKYFWKYLIDHKVNGNKTEPASNISIINFCRKSACLNNKAINERKTSSGKLTQCFRCWYFYGIFIDENKNDISYRLHCCQTETQFNDTYRLPLKSFCCKQVVPLCLILTNVCGTGRTIDGPHPTFPW